MRLRRDFLGKPNANVILACGLKWPTTAKRNSIDEEPIFFAALTELDKLGTFHQELLVLSDATGSTALTG